jgi:hypothetical protein
MHGTAELGKGLESAIKRQLGLIGLKRSKEDCHV